MEGVLDGDVTNFSHQPDVFTLLWSQQLLGVLPPLPQPTQSPGDEQDPSGTAKLQSVSAPYGWWGRAVGCTVSPSCVVKENSQTHTRTSLLHSSGTLTAGSTFLWCLPVPLALLITVVLPTLALLLSGISTGDSLRSFRVVSKSFCPSIYLCYPKGLLSPDWNKTSIFVARILPGATWVQ